MSVLAKHLSPVSPDLFFTKNDPSDLRLGDIAMRELSDFPSLIIDPTLPDPLPRLPVWRILVNQGSVGWTTASSPSEGRTWAMYRRNVRLGPTTSTPARARASLP